MEMCWIDASCSGICRQQKKGRFVFIDSNSVNDPSQVRGGRIFFSFFKKGIYQLFVVVRAQVPNVDNAALVSHQQFALVWVKRDAVHRAGDLKYSLALQIAGPEIVEHVPNRSTKEELAI